MVENNVCEPLLKVEHLKMHYPIRKKLSSKAYAWVKAVDDINFEVTEGDTFGLVGESGCGKTTTGKCILRALDPTGGKILFKGTDLANLSKNQMKPFRRQLQMIFQDPYGSLDPRQSVYSILKEAIVTDGNHHASNEVRDRIDELLLTVELDPYMRYSYPHEMSGGQRQRLGIARALACNPRLIVCDEPVSALDVSIQAQIMNLFRDLQKKVGVTYVFIAHDLAVVRHIATRIAVMYLGKMVETMASEDIYENPIHPYTKALISAIPTTDYHIEKNRKRILLEGEVPSPINAPKGCPFNPRCRYATDVCRQEMPELLERGEKHFVACHNL
jgi:peptide/nickel transport system ATP-binding protein/oligopeptide transport system ATP-binding protein